MSAPTTSDPVAVTTKDGTSWVRRAVTQDGRGLYVVDGSCSCPEFLMATLAELAEHGIQGRAFALPMPAGPVLSGLERMQLRVDEVERAYVFDTAELKRRIAELEAERHVTNEALDDAVQALRASRFFLADVDGADPVLKATEAAAQAHCVAALGSELAGRAFRWAPVGDGVSQVRFTDEPGWGSARVWPLTVSSVDEGECTCPPPTDRPEPHLFGCPQEDAPCPVDGPLPGEPVASLREPEGEHYAQVHHSYLLGHDLPETGGDGRG